MRNRRPEHRDHAVAGMIARSMTRVNIDALMTYADRMLPDYQVAITQDATSRDPSLKNTRAYGAWAVAHQEITL
mgnify:CR=1 FL=1